MTFIIIPEFITINVTPSCQQFHTCNRANTQAQTPQNFAEKSIE